MQPTGDLTQRVLCENSGGNEIKLLGHTYSHPDINVLAFRYTQTCTHSNFIKAKTKGYVDVPTKLYTIRL